MASNQSLAGSFRDPSGFLFVENGVLYRQVNRFYKEDYDSLMDSGLYESLTGSGSLVSHQEVDINERRTDDAYKVIKPYLIPFISYPYEWCFSQLKDAALLTLDIQKTALKFGMSLKDCSAYNIQFLNGKPVFIDTLSFEKYQEGSPWVAYRQFCQHFLAPLALMSYKDVRLNQLFRIYIDGVPLDLASSLLPAKTYLKFPYLTHIHLHAKSQKRYSETEGTEKSGDRTGKTGRRISRTGLLGIIDSLECAVKKLSWNPGGTEWGDYYEDTNYSDDAFEVKRRLVEDFVSAKDPESVWDLGANTGAFSRIASGKGIETVAFDIDPAAVEKNYFKVRKDSETHILPLLLDLTNPSPGLGWDNRERDSFVERGPVDMVFALALIHHIAISNNVPLGRIAAFFRRVAKSLVIEFVPKSDSQVQRLLSSREDIFDEYKQDSFEEAFGEYFTIESSKPVEGSERTLYLMVGKDWSS